MNLTLDEIASHRTRLRQEIMERECLLAAFEVVEKYAARGHAPPSMELGSLVAALLPSRPAVELKELSASPPPPAPAALPSPAPAEGYVHPDLKPFENCFGGTSNAVYWAIQRMTTDYSLRDIKALLTREGFQITGAQISVVLTRMKLRHEIEEIKWAVGREPSIFRKPDNPILPQTNGAEPQPPPLDGPHNAALL